MKLTLKNIVIGGSKVDDIFLEMEANELQETVSIFVDMFMSEEGIETPAVEENIEQ